MVVILLSLLCLCKFNNLILKLHQKKSSYFDEGWLFIGRFEVESVPRMGISISPILQKFRNLLLY